MAKNQADAKQHPEAELLLFNNSHSSFTLSSKNNRTYFKKCTKKKTNKKYKQKKNKKKPNKKKKISKKTNVHEIMRLIVLKKKMKMKHRSHR